MPAPPESLRRALLLLCLAPLSFGLAGCSSGPAVEDESVYLKEIGDRRAAIDKAFGEQKDPIPAHKRATLLPLKYYAVDPGYNVPAVLRLADQRPVFEMPTSTGTLRKMQRVGVLEFTLQGQPMSLGAFVEDGTQQIAELFVPFADLTSGNETYPAGRYLNIFPTQTGLYTIDFNLSYNPYCAYNSTYDCPFPPPSNRLKLAVKAGERAPGV
jgi:uncharacterized protein (DUF1684 family)